MSSCLALRREYNLNQICHTFSSIKKCHNDELVLNPSDPEVGTSEFERRDWAPSESGHVRNEGEELLANKPKPR